MTFVRTRLALDRMAPGQILLVRLRGEEPLRNVPRTAREQGHEVLSLDTDADGVATLLLRAARREMSSGDAPLNFIRRGRRWRRGTHRYRGSHASSQHQRVRQIGIVAATSAHLDEALAPVEHQCGGVAGSHFEEHGMAAARADLVPAARNSAVARP